MKHLDLHISLIAFLNVSEIYLTRVKCLLYSPTQGKIQLHALKKKKRGRSVWNLTQFPSEQILGFQ